MGRFLGITVKRLVPCRCFDGHVEDLHKMSMAWEPDRRFNFFSLPAQLDECTVTSIIEMSLNMTLKFTRTVIYH